jgi:cation diffusion facilitator family transporter
VGALAVLLGGAAFWAKFAHFDAARLDAPQRRRQSAATLSVVFNAFQALVKLAAAVATGSVALLSEAAHSTVDVLASLIAFTGVRAAAEPPDAEHPYGHGKIESLSGFGEALLLAVTMVFVLFEAADHLFRPVRVDHVDGGSWVLAICALGAGLVGRHVKRVGETERSLALLGNGRHLLVDSAVTVTVMAVLLLTRVPGLTLVDPLAAFLLAIWMGWTSLRLGRQAFEQLIDRRISDEDTERICAFLRADQRIVSFHRLRTRLSGAVRLVDVHIVVPRDLSVVEAHTIADDIEKRLASDLAPADVVVHVDPFDPNIEEPP